MGFISLLHMAVDWIINNGLIRNFLLSVAKSSFQCTKCMYCFGSFVYIVGKKKVATLCAACERMHAATWL